MDLTSSLTIPTSWHAGPHSLPPDLVNYFPRSIWLLIASYFGADHLIHALSDDKILALWVKQIELRIIRNINYVEMKTPSGRHNPFNQPAFIAIYPDDIHLEIWFKNCKRHRLDGPAVTEIKSDGRRTEGWYKDDKIHRIGGPAYYTITHDGQCSFEQWRINDKIHRIDGPAEIQIYPSGRRTEEWFKNDKRHRVDGPAFVEIYSDGRREEIWYRHGIQSRPKNLTE